ncbi:hypothetical protein GEMRC1_011482 [Eukaryota sp. GEM-RC1]
MPLISLSAVAKLTGAHQINDALLILFGNNAKVLYEICFFFFEGTVLWNFSSVFCMSFAHLTNLPFFEHSECHPDGVGYSTSCIYQYYTWLGIFAFFVTIISLKNMKEQAIIQILLTFFRGIVITLIIVTSIIGISTGKFSKEPLDPSPVPIYNLKGFGLLFGTAILSQVVHHGVPTLVAECKKKKHVARVFSIALITTGSLYCIVSFLGSTLFGTSVKHIMSLEWFYYTAGRTDYVWWTRLISWVVCLFPPVDILSAFPLGAATLGNTLMAGHGDKNSRKHYVFFRLVAIIPPLLLAATRVDVGIISEIGGLFGFFVCFVLPAVMVLKSRKMSSALGTVVTHYDVLRSPFFAGFIIFVGFVGFFCPFIYCSKLINLCTF